MKPKILDADLADPEHGRAIVEALDTYAADPAGGGRPLAADVRERLVPGLREQPTTLVLLAFGDGRPVGVAVCFFAFSTFRARPLLNVHDLAVVPEWRGRGIDRSLLTAAEAHARSRGCCKLTLEVQDGNSHARALYESFGFADYVVAGTGATRFLEKLLRHP